MEATTPFDLNRELQRWREDLQQSPALRRENLDELEVHLRDSIASLRERGLSDEEAFLIAVRRVGATARLAAEFGKVNSGSVWFNRALWMLIGVQVFSSIGRLESICSLGLAGIARSSSAVSVTILCGTTHLLIFALLLVAGWQFLTRRGHTLSAWMRKAPASFSRLALIIAVCLAPTLLSLASSFSFAHWHRLLTPDFDSPAVQVVTYGLRCASLIEALAMIALTLWLARRQLMAKA